MIRIAGLILILIVDKVYCQGSIEPPPKFPANFRCDDGKYIDNRWFCNNITDCDDKSDEAHGCTWDMCGSGKFKCYSYKMEGPCMNITERCNTIKECPDGSDEWGCGDETDISISDCTYRKGKYLCKDNLRCLDFKYTCDGTCNCFDCSDETDYCKIFNSQSCRPCPLHCLPTPDGPRCICDSSDYKTNKLCKEIENCTGDSSCSQYCTRYNNQTRCLCYEDHHEIRDSNRTTCRSDVWRETALLYSTTKEIKIIHSGLLQVIQNDVNCSVLTAAKSHLYYVDSLNNKERLMKTSISRRKTVPIIELDLKIKSLAADWISSNLYFTVNKSLVVCSNDGRICTRLKCCIVNYVALAPKFGRMFYTQDIIEHYEHMIMTSNMDGSEETALLDTSIDNSSSLAVDEWHEKVYWFQTRNKKLYSASFDGLNQKEYLLSGSTYSSHFSSLERYSYFLEVQGNKIHLTNNFNFKNFVWIIDEDTNNIRELFAYNPRLQLIYDIKNPCVSSPCQGLCLLRSTPLVNDLNYTCICEHFTSRKNNPWCENDTTRSEDFQLDSSMKIEIKMDSSTKPSSPSTKNEPATSTKASATFSGPSSLSKNSSNENYFNIGIIYVASLVTFGFIVLMLAWIIRNDYSIKHCVQDLMENIELRRGTYL